MEIRQYFVLAFDEAQPLGEQRAGYQAHLSMIGYFSSPEGTVHGKTIAEHLDSISIRRMSLPGKKLKKLGRAMVTHLDDEQGELNAAKDELYGALIADGYYCAKPFFYEDQYRPHVSMDPELKRMRKLDSFELTNLSVVESRFNDYYEFLGAEILHTRVL